MRITVGLITIKTAVMSVYREHGRLNSTRKMQVMVHKSCLMKKIETGLL